MKITKTAEHGIRDTAAVLVTVTDTGGNFTGTDLETVLAELAAAFGLTLYTITAVWDGGTVAITGNPEVDVYLPASGTIISWTILADAAAGATPVVIDVWKDTYANYPPTVADTIAGAEKPTLTAVNKNQDLSLASGVGWPITAGDIIRFHMDSTSTVKRVELTLIYRRTP